MFVYRIENKKVLFVTKLYFKLLMLIGLAWRWLCFCSAAQLCFCIQWEYSHNIRFQRLRNNCQKISKA